MKHRGWGRVVNVASAHALVASPYKSAYVAAKHGVAGFTKSVALIISDESDPEAIRSALPAPLQPDGSPIVMYEFIRMPDSAGSATTPNRVS